MVVGSETTGAFCQSEILSGQNVIEVEEGNHVVKMCFVASELGLHSPRSWRNCGFLVGLPVVWGRKTLGRGGDVVK